MGSFFIPTLISRRHMCDTLSFCSPCCSKGVLLIRELIASCVTYGTCQMHRARVTYEVVSHRIFVGTSANSIHTQRCGCVYSRRCLHISTRLVHAPIYPARVRLNTLIRAARAKSVRINWQTLNSLCVYWRPRTHTHTLATWRRANVIAGR